MGEPPRLTQRPVPLENPPNCVTDYFGGQREKPAHLVMIVTLAYELDILETQLYELNEVVDEFVVFEGLYTQRGARKPQIFPQAEKRFYKFRQKMKYYYQDQREVEFEPQDQAVVGIGRNAWVNENIRKIAYERYVQEENAAGRSLSNTLFVNADIDEIPPASGLQRFKYCKTEKLWASFCTVTYDPDFGHIRVFRDPCGKLGNHYWPFPNILRAGEPLRDHGHHLNMYDEMPGFHINARDPTSYLAKMISTADARGFPGLRSDNAHHLLDPESLYATYVCEKRKKSYSLVEVKDFPWPRGLPWFMDANRERFPYLDPDFFPCQGRGLSDK